MGFFSYGDQGSQCQKDCVCKYTRVRAFMLYYSIDVVSLSSTRVDVGTDTERLLGMRWKKIGRASAPPSPRVLITSSYKVYLCTPVSNLPHPKSQMMILRLYVAQMYNSRDDPHEEHLISGILQFPSPGEKGVISPSGIRDEKLINLSTIARCFHDCTKIPNALKTLNPFSSCRVRSRHTCTNW